MGIEINTDKSQLIRVSRKNGSLWIKVGIIKLKEIHHFKYLENVSTRDGYYKREIKTRIDMAKEAYNTKTSHLTSKISLEFRKKLDSCYVWSVALYGSETWTLKKLERKYHWRALKCDAGGQWRR